MITSFDKNKKDKIHFHQDFSNKIRDMQYIFKINLLVIKTEI